MANTKELLSVSGHKFEDYVIGSFVRYGKDHLLIGLNNIEQLLCLEGPDKQEIWVRFENTKLLPF
jgi:hypothetical protein